MRGRIALITGAGRGIGRALALGMTQAGATVIGISRTQRDVAAVARVTAGCIRVRSTKSAKVVAGLLTCCSRAVSRRFARLHTRRRTALLEEGVD